MKHAHQLLPRQRPPGTAGAARGSETPGAGWAQHILPPGPVTGRDGREQVFTALICRMDKRSLD
ncbi:hypothetical protein ACFWAZ_10260 [Streptomyces collinus]|uniref:hypothetical protein n=1 Tax=Streptomyces collinus TaxID=42684 RepID=UPI0036461D9D